ncbi:hotdog fold domain-containing protein [Sciscionella marina]|uniref:hotdog fold domain-containing protein n=1 Tax=Sciscionella marina TaxID=508770 RepID=UPI00037EC33F|nr:hotdog fold domain-containing protein [Sciscionella marina]
MVSTLRLWERLSALPLGNRLFSAAISLRAPYFGTVLPTVTELRPGHAEVRAPKWWGVHNHIGTFHAIAACNLAEVAMGMLAEATVPGTHRWLPRGMTVEYLAKAKTSLRAVAEPAEPPVFGAAQDIPVMVRVYDTAGTEVVRATITIYVTEKK